MDLFVLLLIGYVLGILSLSWWFGRQESADDYLIAGRDRPWWQIMFSKYAATIGAGWFVTYTAFSYEYGMNALALAGGVLIGYVFFAYWGAPRIRCLTEEGGGFYTIGAVVLHTTRSVHAAKLVDAITCVTAFLVMVIAIVAGGLLIDQFGFFGYEAAVVFTLVITLSYILLSGYKAVVITDVVQGVLMLVLLAAVSYGFYVTSSVDLSVLTTGRPIDALTVLMFMVFGIVATFASADRYQLSYAGVHTRAVVKGLFAALFPVFLCLLLVLVIGTVMYALDPNLVSGAVFAVALSEFLPEQLTAIALIMFFATLMSSADTYLYILASHTQSLFGKVLEVRRTRLYLLGMGVASMVAALVFRDVVDLAILTAGLMTSFAFAMVYVLAGKTDAARFLAIVYGGLAGVVIGVFVYGLQPQAAVFVLAGNLIGYVLPLQYVRRIFSSQS